MSKLNLKQVLPIMLLLLLALFAVSFGLSHSLPEFN